MFQSTPLQAVPVLLVVGALGYAVYSFIFNLFVSPLRFVPGPKLWAISQIFYTRAILSGQGHKKMTELHKKYGHVVRVAPQQVSFVDPDVWKQVYGHRRSSGQIENNKDPVFYSLQGTGLIGAISSEEHGRQRRVLSHAFSAQSMAEQEPLIRGYVDLLITKLKEASHQNGKIVPLDVVKWYNLATFDVVGDLSFGESFGGLEGMEYHPWVAVIFPAIRAGAFITEGLRLIPKFDLFLKYTAGWLPISKPREEQDEMTRDRVAHRMGMKAERPDFMRHMIGKTSDGKDKLTQSEILLNTSLLIIAGSETTATSLSGITYLLGTHPEVLARLTKEVREAFSAESEISLLSVQKLKYMLAVLDEGMRLFPAVPGALPRIIHKGGDVICDAYLPEDTVVSSWPWAIYRNPNNFAIPESFIPERWLGDQRFVNDRKEAFRPFSHGPRDCLGKNLAYAEMRFILANLIWNFDIELAEPDKNWIEDNRVYTLWEKDPLNVLLHPRVF